MKLDPVKTLKIEHKIPVEKKQEYKMIGRAFKRRGQYLFALNNTTNEVYKVPIQKVDTIDIQKKDASTNKAVINPNHKMLWAINLKNAKRKFERQLNSFIFTEGVDLSEKEYIKLNDEVRNIEVFLKENENFLTN